MKNRTEITSEKLREIALFIGGTWRYNAILSNNNHYRHYHYLSNDSGLFITVSNEWGKNLAQWEIKFKSIENDTFVRVHSIGCAFDKNPKKIASDLRSRLLSRLGDALKEKESLRIKVEEKRNKKELDNQIIESMKKVLRLNQYPDHRYSQAFRIEDRDGSRLAELKGHYKQSDNFRLCIDDLNAEKVIKVMNLIHGTTVE